MTALLFELNACRVCGTDKKSGQLYCGVCSTLVRFTERKPADAVRLLRKLTAQSINALLSRGGVR
ncbi:MAG: hypothetical protein AAF628_31990 [Planctomycetota bacterium]